MTAPDPTGTIDSGPVRVPDHAATGALTAARQRNSDVAARFHRTIALCQESNALIRRYREGGLQRIAASAAAETGSVFDAESMLVRHLSGRKDVLTPTEWRLLRVFADAGDRLLTRADIARRLWGVADGRSSEVEVYISRLRRKLGGRPQSVIQTVRGMGYRLSRAV
ncbi:MAG: winged helix-turn-helix transcriptional regulator [Candidatus Dormibacteraeota bacterium]|nr:winged helix-turn-helix transcriptional regulator [Candidatus Dormibacteraeota bacterium]